jgi:hypothetical protein
VLKDVVVDGFAFGKIKDFEAGPSQEGDAFLELPTCILNASILLRMAINVSDGPSLRKLWRRASVRRRSRH